eukprot:scaffold4971_cov254-Pinguiococcus_pyrenoidosus.AAC.22
MTMIALVVPFSFMDALCSAVGAGWAASALRLVGERGVAVGIPAHEQLPHSCPKRRGRELHGSSPADGGFQLLVALRGRPEQRHCPMQPEWTFLAGGRLLRRDLPRMRLEALEALLGRAEAHIRWLSGVGRPLAAVREHLDQLAAPGVARALDAPGLHSSRCTGLRLLHLCRTSAQRRQQHRLGSG